MLRRKVRPRCVFLLPEACRGVEGGHRQGTMRHRVRAVDGTDGGSQSSTADLRPLSGPRGFGRAVRQFGRPPKRDQSERSSGREPRLMSSSKWDRRRFNKRRKRLHRMHDQWLRRAEGGLPIKPRHTGSSSGASRRRRRHGMSWSTEKKVIRNRQNAAPPKYKHGQRPSGHRRPPKRPMVPR